MDGKRQTDILATERMRHKIRLNSTATRLRLGSIPSNRLSYEPSKWLAGWEVCRINLLVEAHTTRPNGWSADLANAMVSIRIPERQHLAISYI